MNDYTYRIITAASVVELERKMQAGEGWVPYYGPFATVTEWRDNISSDSRARTVEGVSCRQDSHV